MKHAPITTFARLAALAACLTFFLWSLPGCGGGGSESQDEDSHSHAAGEETDDHAHADGVEDDDGHSHDEADADHGHEHDFIAPTTYAGAVHMIQESMDSIRVALAENQLAEIHIKAEVVTNVAKLVGALALVDGSGIPREAVRDLNVAGRELALASNTLLELADTGDKAKSQAEFDKMKTHVATLTKYADPVDDHGHVEDADHGHDH